MVQPNFMIVSIKQNLSVNYSQVADYLWSLDAFCLITNLPCMDESTLLQKCFLYQSVIHTLGYQFHEMSVYETHLKLHDF